MPIEIARLAGQATAKPENVFELRPRPVTRKPQIQPADNDEQKRKIANACDRVSCRTSRTFCAEPAMLVRYGVKKIADAGCAFAQHCARVRIGINRASAVKGEGDGRSTGGTRCHGHWRIG